MLNFIEFIHEKERKRRRWVRTARSVERREATLKEGDEPGHIQKITAHGYVF